MGSSLCHASEPTEGRREFLPQLLEMRSPGFLWHEFGDTHLILP